MGNLLSVPHIQCVLTIYYTHKDAKSRNIYLNKEGDIKGDFTHQCYRFIRSSHSSILSYSIYIKNYANSLYTFSYNDNYVNISYNLELYYDNYINILILNSRNSVPVGPPPEYSSLKSEPEE